MWLVAGQWKFEPPQPNAPSDEVPKPNPPTTYTTGSITIHLRDDKFGDPVAGLYVQIAGYSVGTQQAGASGDVTFSSLIPGRYRVRLLGRVNNQAGGSTYVDTSKIITLANGATMDATFLINVASSTQSLSACIGCDSDQTGVQDGGGGTSSGIIQDALNALFVPQQSSIDNLKSNLNAWYTWGPFNALSQLSGLSSTSANEQFTMSVPAFRVANNGRWEIDPSGTPTALNLSGTASSISGWTWLRSAMGALVYLFAVVGLVKKLMPRQQI
jgi:hypothetical protein